MIPTFASNLSRTLSSSAFIHSCDFLKYKDILCSQCLLFSFQHSIHVISALLLEAWSMGRATGVAYATVLNVLHILRAIWTNMSLSLSLTLCLFWSLLQAFIISFPSSLLMFTVLWGVWQPEGFTHYKALWALPANCPSPNLHSGSPVWWAEGPVQCQCN